MSGKFKTIWFCAEPATYTQNEGLINKKTVEYTDAKSVNLDAFAQGIHDAYEEMDAQGYEVINVIPVAMGATEPSIASRGEYLGDAGFTPTRAAVVVGRRKDSE